MCQARNRNWIKLPTCFLFVGLTSAGYCHGQSSAEAQLLQELTNLHKSSRELIHNSHCRVDFEVRITGVDGKERIQSCRGECWHSRDAVRLKVEENGELAEYVWRNSLQKSLLTRPGSKGPVYAAGLAAYASPYLHRCDAWIVGHLVLNLPETGDYDTFERLVELATSVKKVWRSNEGGRDIATVRLSFAKSAERKNSWLVDVVFDPAVNYLVRKSIYFFGGSTPDRSEFRREEEVSEFVEPKPGVFFPQRIIWKVGSGTKLDQSSGSAELTNIIVNADMPSSTFNLNFPNGILMSDSVTMTTYRVDRVGKRISDPKPMGTLPPAPAAKGDGGGKEIEETLVEPVRRWHYWVISGSIVAILVGLVLYRRRR